MFEEPNLYCNKCDQYYTMEELSSRGMRCPKCGGKTQILDAQIISKTANNDRQYQAAPVPIFGLGTFSNTLTSLSGAHYDRIKVGELFLPATNEVNIQAVKQFISNLPLPVALEYFSNCERLTMLVRGPESNLRSLASLIRSNWPKAYLKILDSDPVFDEQMTSHGHGFSFDITLEKDDYIPITIWENLLNGDPVTNILSTMTQLYTDERIWIQIKVNEQGMPEWLEKVHRRLKIEKNRGYAVNDSVSSMSNYNVIAQKPVVSSLRIGYMISMFFLAVAAGTLGILFITQQYLLMIIAFIVTILIVFAGYKLFGGKNDSWDEVDPTILGKKVLTQSSFAIVTIRAGVWSTNTVRARQLTERLIATLGQYGSSGGNRFRINPEEGYPLNRLWTELDPSRRKLMMWLGDSEIAGLWHPPIIKENQLPPSLMPTSHVEIRSPDPRDVTGFFKIGQYFRPDGFMADAYFPENAFSGNNIIIFGKPGAGKTNLMKLLGIGGILHPSIPFVVMLDPHQDMVRDMLETIPPEHADRVIYWNLDDPEHTISLNLLDTNLFQQTPTQVAQMFVDNGKALWGEYWGPRMQIPFTYAVRALALANTIRPPDDLLGLSIVDGILSVNKDNPGRLADFLHNELPDCPEKTDIMSYFLDTFMNLSQHMRDEIIQPVLSKSFRFREDPIMQTFSAPKSTINLRELVRDRKILLINTNMPKLGKEMSDFLGSMILNIIGNAITSQGDIEDRSQRVPVCLIIDEFHKYSGVNWEDIFQQFRKFGGEVIVGTQSLATIRQNLSQEAPGIIFAGAYTTFSFTVNSEDAEEISREMGGKNGGPPVDSLVYLDKYLCYARQVNEDNRKTSTCYTLNVESPWPSNNGIKNRIMENRKKYSKPKSESVQASISKIGYFSRITETPASIGSGIPSSVISPDANAVFKKMSGDDGSDPFSDLTNNSTTAWVDPLVNSPESVLTKNNGKKGNQQQKVEPKDIFGDDDPMSQEMLNLFNLPGIPPEQEA